MLAQPLLRPGVRFVRYGSDSTSGGSEATGGGSVARAFRVRGERDVADARKFVLQQCRSFGFSVCEDAALLASEVVTNALRHAPGGSISVRAERDGEQLVVQVLDASPEEPMLLEADPWGERGRGMALVDAIADEWGVAPHPAGKVVWFRL